MSAGIWSLRQAATLRARILTWAAAPTALQKHCPHGRLHQFVAGTRRCNCLDCHEFSSTPLRFRPHPRMPMQLSFRPHPRMQRCCSGTARQHRTGQSWASNDDPLKDLSNTRALKHLAPLATDYWAASIVSSNLDIVGRSKFGKLVRR